ncbi:MAG TPA: DUF4864 domain-containing protein [Methyloceanibacter sp.]|jgi:hypothetical protein|nr:DUF4864 domain-containing protein [Methyloceanibacter sp.]
MTAITKTFAAAATAALLIATGASAQQQLASISPDVTPPRVTIVPKSAPIVPETSVPETTPDSVIGDNDRLAIKDAVRDQLRALATLKAGDAFAQLAPSTQKYFGEPDTFLLQIAENVAPILSTKKFAFIGVGRDETSVFQEVLITDEAGLKWQANFQVQRQPDGSWRVSGCVVDVARGQAA